MLTKQTYHLIGNGITFKTAQLLPWQAKVKNRISELNNLGIRWQSDPESFQLIANETINVGTPVNRNDADYWIEQIKARAIGEGERVGRVKVAEVAR